MNEAKRLLSFQGIQFLTATFEVRISWSSDTDGAVYCVEVGTHKYLVRVCVKGSNEAVLRFEWRPIQGRQRANRQVQPPGKLGRVDAERAASRPRPRGSQVLVACTFDKLNLANTSPSLQLTDMTRMSSAAFH